MRELRGKPRVELSQSRVRQPPHRPRRMLRRDAPLDVAVREQGPARPFLAPHQSLAIRIQQPKGITPAEQTPETSRPTFSAPCWWPASLNLWRFSESLSPDEVMGVIGGWERDCGQEIRGEAERRGARSARSFDPRGQETLAVAEEGAHLVEGGHLGDGRGMERQRDLGGVGDEPQPDRSASATTGRGGVRGDAEPEISSKLRPAAHFRRDGGGEIDRSDRLAGPRGIRALAPAPARREGCRIEDRREGQRQHERTNSKKTRSNLTANGNGGSRRTPAPASWRLWLAGSRSRPHALPS
jgi:hypothetical protein